MGPFHTSLYYFLLRSKAKYFYNISISDVAKVKSKISFVISNIVYLIRNKCLWTSPPQGSWVDGWVCSYL